MNFQNRFSPTIAVTLVLCAGMSVHAEDRGDGSPESPFVITRATGEIVIDGAVDEPAWEEATRLEIGYEVSPGENIPPPVSTEVRLTYDDKAVLVAFRCSDPNPGEIRARFSDRDHLLDDDWVSLVIDTFNDERRAYEFVANPLGVQMDAINDDVSKRYDVSWNAIWFSKGRITAGGYEVEIAIPFNQLRFQKTSGPQVWGIDFVRSYPRVFRHHLGFFARQRGENSYLSQTLKIVGFEGAEQGKNLEIVPTLTGARVEERADVPNGPLEVVDETVQAGITGAWGVTPNITLAGAVNPDFSQVEADAVQLGINQTFALFYRETRPFFQVGADYFETPLRMLHTRMIVDPAIALKATGKVGRHTFGVFSALDDTTNLIVPGAEDSQSGSFDQRSLASVGRYRFDFARNSTTGVMITDRKGEDGYFSRALSLDVLYRMSSSDKLTANIIWTRTRYNADMVEELEIEDVEPRGRGILVDYNHSVRNWEGWAWFRDIDEDFRLDLGFRPNVDFRKGGVGGNRIWWGDEEDWYTKIEAGVAFDYGQRQDGSFFERETEAWIDYQGAYQSAVHLGGTVGTTVFGGEHFPIDGFFLLGRIRPNRVFELDLQLRSGRWIDFEHTRSADRLRIAPEVTIRPGRHLLLGFEYTYLALDVEAGRLFTAGVAEMRGIWQFNVRTFVRVILQYTEITKDPTLYAEEVDRENRDLFTQLLFSYKVNPRTVVYVGYSDGSVATENYGLTVQDRTVFAKLGYSFFF